MQTAQVKMQKLKEKGGKLKFGKIPLAATNLHLPHMRKKNKTKKKTHRVLPELQIQEQQTTTTKGNSTLQIARSSSGLTFDPDEIAAGVNGVKVTNTKRPCRVSVSILGAKNLKRPKTGSSVKDPVFKVRIDHASQTSKEMRNIHKNEDGVMAVNQTFNFEVQDIKTATLSVYVYNKALWGMEESLGSCIGLNVANFLQENGAGREEGTKWYDLLSKDCKALSGKVLLHIGGGIADPEQKITTFVGTWNVGKTRPPMELSSWIPTNNAYQIVAIGAQECDYQPQKAFADCGKEWLQVLNTNLGFRYKLIHAISRGQMRLAIFVRDDVVRALSEIDSGSLATGVGHVMANKGGVAISFKLWDTSLCFINCHFAAHMGHCQTRNSNYREIAGQLRIGYPRMEILNQFHYVFWFGDLNYRLDLGGHGEKKRPWQRVVKAIEAGRYNEILQFDELRREREASRVLYGFKEGEINFPPTFKVEKGALSLYNKRRMPAWCDRILWRTLPGHSVKLTSYVSTPTMLTSDHKPVAATFTITVHALPSSFSSMDEEDKRWHIRFTSMRAKNLRASDINGFSDPYICFEGENILRETRSKVKVRTLNPVWNPKELRPLVLRTFPLQRLEKEYVFLRVLDYNYTSNGDTLGYAVIPLAQAVQAFNRGPNGVAHFKVGLLHHGLPAGTLEGGIQLTWEINILKRRPFDNNESMMRKSGFKNFGRILTKRNFLRHS
ncbi:hypothetical protein O6H91_13G035900 [Diphasiastrum complanatum]|uniref:Uncharacterized protein n=3 Tax=Diphasiastrum complanatum TaxID=34168 RepID=A0ACC2BTS6_DIPCM|nr:hypothetical protein O6H91_13G035900 [Diphasiastrum complanatum]KAJ7533170.1 hypothetical protein O6H91_13G035900 [Diphasiastrum complanatum]